MRNRRDIFRIRKFRRIYDRRHDRFNFHVEYETHTEITPRSLVIAEAFGLGIDETQKFPVLNTELQISPKDVVLITGDSGSGKSVLLRAIREDLGAEAVDMADIQVDPDKPLIETIGNTVEQAIELLSKVGLNDAFLFLRPYKQLSDGQKYRYRLAKLIESERQWWLMDEFGALLDRDTAKIIAYNVQKIARQQGKAVIAATTHDDISLDLSPSVHVHKRFGDEIAIKYYPDANAQQCSLLKEMQIEKGTLEDWKKLSKFHYRSHNCGATRAIFCIKRNNELCGVIVYSYPPPNCAGRNQTMPKMPLKELNKQLSLISRVVIHPKYRTIGLGEALIRETLPLAGTPYVEMVAVMPKYNPFAEKAGMQKAKINEPPKQAQRMAQTLKELGFDIQLLGSNRYVRSKLDTLSTQQIGTLKEAFKKNDHARFRRELSAMRHTPYGTTKLYRQGLAEADLEKIARLVKVTGIILQTKTYLFWALPQITLEHAPIIR